MKLRILWLAFALTFASIVHAASFGEFVGKVVAEWLEDGRKMKLTQSFAYISPSGTRWDAPAGSVVDGASIPQFAWTIIGGPFEGRYRNASVIHDVACNKRDRSWQSVHEAFYTAMLASGVEKNKAKIIYAAVYHFGPRWPRRFELSNVPLQDVDSRVASVSTSADQLEKRIVDVRPRIPLVRGGSVPPQTEQTKADVTVMFIPLPTQVSFSDFEGLKKAIEAGEMSLEEIRAYSKTSQPK